MHGASAQPTGAYQLQQALSLGLPLPSGCGHSPGAAPSMELEAVAKFRLEYVFRQHDSQLKRKILFLVACSCDPE